MRLDSSFSSRLEETLSEPSRTWRKMHRLLLFVCLFFVSTNRRELSEEIRIDLFANRNEISPTKIISNFFNASIDFCRFFSHRKSVETDRRNFRHRSRQIFVLLSKILLLEIFLEQKKTTTLSRATSIESSGRHRHDLPPHVEIVQTICPLN